MFAVDLPYSKDKFVIPVITFKDIFNLSRLRYDNNTLGFVATLDNILKFSHLNVVDKFFILLKIKQFFVNDTITLTVNEKTVNVLLSNLITNLCEITNKHQVIQHGQYTIELDLPQHFLTQQSFSDIYESVVHSIAVGSQKFDLNSCSIEDKRSLLELLPPTFMPYIKKFVMDESHKVTLFSTNNDSLDSNNLTVNFITSQPYEFIYLLFSDYDLHSCREILFSLSKRMNSETILQSTVNDVTSYMTLYNDEIKQQNNSGNTGIGI